MSNKITCTCGHSWNKSDSSKKDATVCHICGKNNAMKKVKGWLDKFDEKELQLGGNVYPTNYTPQAQNGLEGSTDGFTDQGFNYNGAWGGTMQYGGNLPGAVGSMYAREGAPSNGPYAKKTLASAQDGTNAKKPLVKLSPDEMHMEQLKNVARNKANKEQPTVQSRGSMPDDFRQKLYRDAQNAEFRKNLLKGADVATDVMQVGNFVPHPIGQAIGEAGNMLGGWIDSYEAYDAYNKGNYGDVAMNAASVALPMVLGAKGYRRDMWNTEPGSVADRIASLGDREGRYIHLTPPNRLKNNPVIKKGVNFNRSLLGALGTETAYDSYQNGGEMSFYQNGLDWTPRNISRDGSQIPQAQMGWQERLAQETAKLDDPLSTLQLTKKGYSKEKIKDIQSAVNKQRSTVGTPKGKQLSREEILARNKQYALEAGKVFNPESGSVSNFLSPGRARNLERGSESIMNAADYAMNVPGRILQSQYKQGYGLEDALMNRPSGASMLEEGLADPTNIGSLGLKGLGKGALKALSKLGAKGLTKKALSKGLLSSAILPFYKSIDKDPRLMEAFKSKLDEVKNLMTSQEARNAFKQIGEISTRKSSINDLDKDYAKAITNPNLPIRAIDEYAQSIISPNAAEHALSEEQLKYINNAGSLVTDASRIGSASAKDRAEFLIENGIAKSANDIGISPRDMLSMLSANASMSGLSKAEQKQIIEKMYSEYGLVNTANPLASRTAAMDLISLADAPSRTGGKPLSANLEQAIKELQQAAQKARPDTHIDNAYYDARFNNANSIQAVPSLFRDRYASVPSARERQRASLTAGREASEAVQAMLQDKGGFYTGSQSLSADSFAMALRSFAKKKNLLDIVPVHEGSPRSALIYGNDYAGITKFDDTRNRFLESLKPKMDQALGIRSNYNIAAKQSNLLNQQLLEAGHYNYNINDFNKKIGTNMPGAFYKTEYDPNYPDWTGGQIRKPNVGVVIKKDGGPVRDDNGYWNPENWGKPVEIGSNNITMRGVNQPLIGISDEGDVQYMEPGEDYKFKGKKVTEYPIAEDGYTGSSVVDYLSTKGLSSTKSARKELAREFNVDDYDYSSGKNLELLEKLRNSDEKLNKMKKDYTPISIERLEQMLGKKQDKKAPSPSPSYNAPKKPINKAMLDLMMTQPSFNPNIEKPALNLADATTVSSEEISPIQTSFGIDPSAWNTSGINPRISRSQPNGAPLPQIDTNMIWNTSGASPRVISPQQESSSFPGIDPNQMWNTSGISPRVFDQQEENSSLPNIDFNQAWNTSGTSPRNINTQQPFSTVSNPLWRSDAASIPNTQGAPFSTVPTPLWGNNPQVNQPTNNLTNIGDPTAINAMGIPNIGMDAINDVVNYVKKGIKYGPSLAKRMASMLIGDDESTISKPLAFKKLPVVNNKEEFSKKEFDESPFDPITTGNIRSDEHDTEHRGPGFYHTNEMIDLDKFKFGFHNREGQGSTTDKFNVTKTEGLIIPVFDKEYGEADGIDAGGTRSIRKYKDSEIKDTKLYGGVDDKGKFYLDYGKNLKGKDLTMADFRYIDATGFAKDADGNFVLGNETSNNKIAKVPHLINTKGKEEHLNILVPKLGKDQHLKYGDITGGRMILTTPDMKHKFLASGSLQDLNDTLEEFKKRFKTESVRVVVLDNGTFSRGLRKTNKKIYKNDWKKYDKANDQGGAGFYYYKDGGEVKPTTGWLDKYN